MSEPRGTPGDVVDVLLNDSNDQLTDDLISDNMIDLMIPAEDSVPVLLTLAAKYLSDCPLALRQLEYFLGSSHGLINVSSIQTDGFLSLSQEENMQLKKSKSLLGETLQWTDYMSLSFTQDVSRPTVKTGDIDRCAGMHTYMYKYTTTYVLLTNMAVLSIQVITETLRMGNIISGIMRKAMKDVEIKGHLIPKGWCVFAYFRSVHLDDDLYEEAYCFNPWRWKGKDTGTCGFTPFGGGRRLCPGLDLARLEASIFLHHLVTGFTWVAEEDHIVNFPTVRMKRRMPIRVRRKN
ncbi:hypothetical protein GW17_00007096 [Ensete ventricosum]|nr:hypothetical protein GW17_00007096 [Ensete ventricosum]